MIEIKVTVCGEIHLPELAALLARQAPQENAYTQAEPSDVKLPTPEPAKRTEAPRAVPEAVPVAPAPEPVPTTPAREYSIDEIAAAGARLITTDPSSQAKLAGLLAKYGLQTVRDLPRAQTAAFVADLTALGAVV